MNETVGGSHARGRDLVINYMQLSERYDNIKYTTERTLGEELVESEDKQRTDPSSVIQHQQASLLLFAAAASDET